MAYFFPRGSLVGRNGRIAIPKTSKILCARYQRTFEIEMLCRHFGVPFRIATDWIVNGKSDISKFGLLFLAPGWLSGTPSNAPTIDSVRSNPTVV